MNNEDVKIEEALRRYKVPKVSIELKDKIFQTKNRLWNRTWLSAAAGIVIAAGLGLIWQFLSKPTTSEIKDIRLMQIEQTVTRTGTAVQLLALADFWATQPEGKNRAQEIYIEVANSFSDLDAGIQAQSRLKSFKKEQKS
jgi:hypothetical protein